MLCSQYIDFYALHLLDEGASDECKIVQIKLIRSNEMPIKHSTINQLGTGCCQWTTKRVEEIKETKFNFSFFPSVLDEWMVKTKKICSHTVLLKRFDDAVNVDICVCTQNYGFRHMYFGVLHCLHVGVLTHTVWSKAQKDFLYRERMNEWMKIHTYTIREKTHPINE